MKEYLLPTYYIDSDHPKVIEFAEQICKFGKSKIEKAILLYYAVRDGIRYNPYSIKPLKASMKASYVLNKKDGYCVAKAVLLTALARTQQIPARLGFADVKNHLNTKQLKRLMGTDVFIFHGYTDLFLNNKWVKATPAFNKELCNNFNVKPLEFDGKKDSIFHPLDKSGNKHMEYVKDHGTFADLPWDMIVKELIKFYPVYFKEIVKGAKKGSYDFAKQALNK